MKTNLLSLLAFFMLAIGYSQAVGDTFIHNNITYSITSVSPNTVTVIDYNLNGGTDVTVPETVTPNSASRTSSSKTSSLVTYTVTAIGYQAFFNDGITNVNLPNSVISIGNDAFRNNFLSNIVLPEGLTSIGDSSFNNNQLSSNVTIPDNVIDIGPQAFSVNYITAVTLGSSVATIGFSAFYNNNLTTISIPDSVTTIDARAFDDNLITTVIMGSGVITIGFKAFANNPLACVTSKATTPPTVVTDVANDSFGNRNNINLTIPTGTVAEYNNGNWTGFNSITESSFNSIFTVDYITYQINASANNEVTITSYDTAGGLVVNIPATIEQACTTYTVTAVGYLAFNSKGLTNVSIPNGMVVIGDSAFSNNNLSGIIIPDTVTTIDNDAFNNNQLTSVTLSDNLTYIGEGAFAFNDLPSVIIPDSVVTIDNVAFAQNNIMTSLVLGNNVTSIGDAAFRFTALTSMTLPESITNIGVVAFGGLGGTSAITDIYCQGMVPPTISTSGSPNSDTFNQARSTIHLHIPAGTMGAYVTDTGALWTGFNPVTEGALGISDFELTNDVKVITNLNQIEIEHSKNIQLHSFNIYSMSGDKVMEGNKNTFTTEELSKGIYIIELNFDKGRLTKKFIK